MLTVIHTRFINVTESQADDSYRQMILESSASDIVYTATSSPDYVIDKGLLEANGLDGGRPLMLVDIAVPRNIGPDSDEVSC